MKLPQDDFPLVVLSGSESACHPEERSEEGSGLVLACFGLFWLVLACFGLFWLVLACLGFLGFLGFVILSVSEESDFAFEKSYPRFFALKPGLRMTRLQIFHR